MLKRNFIFDISTQRALLAFLMISFMSFSYATAQIREDKQQNSEKLDDLRIQIEQSTEKTQDLEQQARIIRQEILDIQQNLIKSAAKIQAIEDDIIQKESNLKELQDREIELEERLKVKNFEMASTLGAMQRLSIQKSSVVAFKPDEAVNTLRTTSLLRVILPVLKNRADILQEDLSELNSVREEISQQNIDLRGELTRLVIFNNDIDDLLIKRMIRQEALEYSTQQERDKLKSFAENAEDIQDLINQIEKEIVQREEAAKRAEANIKDKPNVSDNGVASATIPMPAGGITFASAKGRLPIPARGTIGQVFGQLMSTGQRSKGITIDTRAGATVIAPHEGRVEFAGNFRTYGQLLIISHGEGYHTLLAGMENINSIVGQWILKGEPVGQMATDLGPPNSRQKLYVEFRQSGKPINPLPWIVAMDRGGK